MNIFKLTAIALLSSVFFSSASADISVPELTETTNLVMAGNKYVTLLGNQVKVGDQAPDFKVVTQSFSPVTLAEFKQKPVLISVVPSLDTGVCSIQTKRFNDEVANLPENVVMLTISNDLPFAQKRFCKTEKVENIKVLSDAVWRDFGHNYGLLIKDMGLLTRAIFIIDVDGKIAYKELVGNISQHPDYETALTKLRSMGQKVQPTKTTTSEHSG
ncbi:thiol peroxidase [Colwellia sp. MB02u-18]|uniref:thiol peroxidase n=1 Tax=unclassified Colwellia TaxID=196834 RepID=UPI0015F48D6B|nr:MULTISPECIES: thiol peroxidase [unclassified Colwellia]MBA6223934.1 thiol peroxidase [Colwellia sp. MB3u-45]MBA6267359.1 thiol peroxidase [Colwellia sp. MB3u-43]MBA6320115.1 thiol peroxidase [Colwellia sp. MB02u-19]MBA6324815.1 thiol peroxidase [Colwellia sp. MB02u-18]MBA6330496.1 thiol peroxidase [Colwellia sp. MB02u-12]